MAERGAEVLVAATFQPAAERGQRLERRFGRVHERIFRHTSPWMHHLLIATLSRAGVASVRLSEGHDGSLHFEAWQDGAWRPGAGGLTDRARA